MKDTKKILMAWKNSRVLKRLGTEYPCKSLVIQGAKEERDYRQYLTEEECTIVDRALLALKEDNYYHYTVIKAVYINSQNCSNIARVTGIKKSKVYKMLDDAEGFIRGYIYAPFNKRNNGNKVLELSEF